MAKIHVEHGLYERARQAAEKAGYSSVDELVANAIENELKRMGAEEDAEQRVADQLRGLGYLQ